ncbi:1807_t:CDS:2, partial [Cetraspora pellucida]
LQTIEDNYKYVSNLPDEEVKNHLETAEKAARVKINNKEEDRKKALYNVICMNINRIRRPAEEFNQMQLWKQQVAIRNFLIESKFATE